jgi:hypothetical protein
MIDGTSAVIPFVTSEIPVTAPLVQLISGQSQWALEFDDRVQLIEGGFDQ